MKIEISESKWYPVYYAEIAKKNTVFALAAVSGEEWADYERMCEHFHRWQARLRQLYFKNYPFADAHKKAIGEMT